MNYQLPFKLGDKVIELGGGNNPIFHPNVDTRKLPTVDMVIDFNNPPYVELKNNEYDLVYSSYLIEHISWRKVKEFVNEIYRILRPGGKAYIITANLYEQCKAVANSNKWDENFSTMIFGDLDYPENSHKFGLSPDYAIQLFKEIGFKKVDVIPHPNCKTDMIIDAAKIMTVETVVQKDSYSPYNRAYYDGDSKQGYHPPGYSNFPSNYTIANEILSQLKQLKIENQCTTKDVNISNVLELGGGRGYISHILEGKGINATCLDVARHCWYTRTCKNFVLADATERLPFENKQFDLAFSKDFLEHIPEEKIDNLVKDVARVSMRGFHLVTFSDHPHSRDDSTHQCLKSKDWWISKFKEFSDPDYIYTIEDKDVYEHSDLDVIKKFHTSMM